LKIAIAIPIYNESESVVLCLEKVNNQIENLNSYDFDVICINDGSEDNSLNLLEPFKNQITILSSEINFGLSEVFNSVLHYSKDKNYDYLVIFDADLQYPIEDLEALLLSTNNNKADILIGCRNFRSKNHFKIIKKYLQIIGSRAISFILGKQIKDATSGYRVYSKRALNNLFTTNSFTYTLETLFQAVEKKMIIFNLELSGFNKTRESRLFKSNFEYIIKSFFVILKSITLYRRKSLFKILLISSIPGFLLFSRFFITYFNQGYNSGNLQSLIVGTFYLIILFLIYILIFQYISYVKMNTKLLQIEYRPRHKKY
tara:strand:+ start:136 stop:1080 length:945 start_codon:yes stop_codon:yes gene_type:complete